MVPGQEQADDQQEAAAHGDVLPLPQVRAVDHGADPIRLTRPRRRARPRPTAPAPVSRRYSPSSSQLSSRDRAQRLLRLVERRLAQHVRRPPGRGPASGSWVGAAAVETNSASRPGPAARVVEVPLDLDGAGPLRGDLDPARERQRQRRQRAPRGPGARRRRRCLRAAPRKVGSQDMRGTVVISGASTGIGRATALHLRGLGFRCARRRPPRGRRARTARRRCSSTSPTQPRSTRWRRASATGRWRASSTTPGIALGGPVEHVSARRLAPPVRGQPLRARRDDARADPGAARRRRADREHRLDRRRQALPFVGALRGVEVRACTASRIRCAWSCAARASTSR